MGLKYLNSLRIRDPGWRQFGSGIWDGKKPDMEILIIFVSSQGYTEDTVRIFVNCVYWCRNVSYKEEIFKKGKLKKLEITFGPKMALASAQGHWRGQKSLKGKIFIVHPFNWAALWVSPPKNNFIPQHLQNGYINSYKHIPKLFSYSHTVEIFGPPPPHPFQLALPSELGGGESLLIYQSSPPPPPAHFILFYFRQEIGQALADR